MIEDAKKMRARSSHKNKNGRKLEWELLADKRELPKLPNPTPCENQNTLTHTHTHTHCSEPIARRRAAVPLSTYLSRPTPSIRRKMHVHHLGDEREGGEVLEVLDEAHEHQPRHAQEDYRRLSEREKRVQVSCRARRLQGRGEGKRAQGWGLG